MTVSVQKTDEQKTKPPVVLACAGGTPLARLSYDLAVTLEKDGLADMACLLALNTESDAQSLQQRDLIVIDGCSRQCVKCWLTNKNISPRYYFDLSAPIFGLDPKSAEECTLKDLFNVLNIIHQQIPTSTCK